MINDQLNIAYNSSNEALGDLRVEWIDGVVYLETHTVEHPNYQSFVMTPEQAEFISSALRHLMEGS